MNLLGKNPRMRPEDHGQQRQSRHGSRVFNLCGAVAILSAFNMKQTSWKRARFRAFKRAHDLVSTLH